MKRFSMVLALFVVFVFSVTPAVASAVTPCGDPKNTDQVYTPSIDIGCRGKGNPILDASFGILRFLSAGVGLIVIGSIVFAGIQYSASRGDPQATAAAINRIQSSVIALLIYIFGFAFLNYILPAGILK
ncbi:MAG: hypothetical protein JWO41_141 [Candidatus Saccharibacteria bacterium]|nr:hypothetical protein [Candidatus Saccharibacteria bacterium]